MRQPLTIESLVPGGILATDHLHVTTNDGTCSRCRRLVPDAEVPLMLWLNDGEDLLIYCPACCGSRPNLDVIEGGRP